MSNKNTIITTIHLYKEHIDFLSTKPYNVSSLFRSLIDNYPDYKEWKEKKQQDEYRTI